ncbi:MAG: DUF2304 family protein [Thermococci archaeon]|nr:DUF2304 family protein [Thermococci archaeon]
MYVVQYVSLVVLAYIALQIAYKYHKRELEWREVTFWEVIVAIFVLISLFPIRISQEIQRFLGLRRGLDAIFVLSIGILYVISFKIYMSIDRTQREITKLTREVAIRLGEMEETLEKLRQEAGRGETGDVGGSRAENEKEVERR